MPALPGAAPATGVPTIGVLGRTWRASVGPGGTIEVWDGLLTLPVIGTVDTERAQYITEALLRRVTETHCRAVILDLTAVEDIDAATAGHLLRIVQALRLLGVQCALCGIGAQLARTIASLDLDLAGVPTLPQLKEALRQFVFAHESKAPRLRKGGG